MSETGTRAEVNAAAGGDSAIEIAYRLPHDCWSHGYATEMARAVMVHGFDALRLERIVGVTYPENEPLQRVLLKIGMRAEGESVHYGRTMRVFAAERWSFGSGDDR